MLLQIMIHAFHVTKSKPFYGAHQMKFELHVKPFNCNQMAGFGVKYSGKRT
jgi:hypothetical protein